MNQTNVSHETIEQFLAQYQVGNTKKTYRLALNNFFKWKSKLEWDGGIEHYTQYLLSKGLTNKTVNHQMIVLSKFFEFLGQPFKYKRLKEWTPPIEVLTQNATERLLGAASEEFRAVLMFMMDSGVRVGEMARISAKQYEQVSDTYTIVGKGNKQRMIVIGVNTRQLLEKSMQNGLLFGRSYSVATIQRQLGKAAAKAGLKGVHAHSIRHSFATKMLDKGVGIDRVQKMLGHSSVTTTMMYTHLSEMTLKVDWSAALAKNENQN